MRSKIVVEAFAIISKFLKETERCIEAKNCCVYFKKFSSCEKKNYYKHILFSGNTALINLNLEIIDYNYCLFELIKAALPPD